MKFVLSALKAFYGAAVAGLGSLGTVLVGDTSIGQVTSGQWVAIALSTLIAFGAVYGVTNSPKGGVN